MDEFIRSLEELDWIRPTESPVPALAALAISTALSYIVWTGSNPNPVAVGRTLGVPLMVGPPGIIAALAYMWIDGDLGLLKAAVLAIWGDIALFFTLLSVALLFLFGPLSAAGSGNGIPVLRRLGRQQFMVVFIVSTYALLTGFYMIAAKLGRPRSYWVIASAPVVFLALAIGSLVV